MTIGMFYRWEDHNHGLEHKCGTCATVLSSPRAKKTCIGVHEEVCPAYHKTLHFIGASHQCAACSNTIKAHDKRHLEIAEIIQAIHRLEGSAIKNSPLHNNKRKGKKRDISVPEPSDGADDIDRTDREKERDWDSGSSTLNNDDDAQSTRNQWSGAMESADARKAAKAERKTAKNQVLFDIISQADLAIVQKALHPESEQGSEAPKGQGLVDNNTIDENISYNAHTFRWSSLRQSVHAKKMAKNNGGKARQDAAQDDEILAPIFASIGVSTNLTKASKERKSLDAKLRAAILEDLVAFKNDQMETMQRMAGYWRYVNRRTYNEMVRNNEIWDWATGEKLPEIREEVELDVIEEQDENAEATTPNEETEGHIPEQWDDPDFVLPAGQTELCLSPLFAGSIASGTVGRSDAPTNQSHEERDTKLDEEINSTGDCISKLSLSPRHLASQTLSLNNSSPVSSHEHWARLPNEFGDRIEEGSETLNGSPTPRRPFSPATSNSRIEKGFQGVKDTRVFAKAIREASPPSNDTPQAPPQPALQVRPAPSKTEPTPDPLNRFGALNHETPAPCEEVKKADAPLGRTVVKVPAKPIVKVLAVHDDVDDWQTQQPHRSKGKKVVVKASPAVALRQQAAVNVHARKGAGGESFAAAVKKGL